MRKQKNWRIPLNGVTYFRREGMFRIMESSMFELSLIRPPPPRMWGEHKRLQIRRRILEWEQWTGGISVHQNTTSVDRSKPNYCFLQEKNNNQAARQHFESSHPQAATPWSRTTTARTSRPRNENRPSATPSSASASPSTCQYSPWLCRCYSSGGDHVLRKNWASAAQLIH